jgi:hypothetical protein
MYYWRKNCKGAFPLDAQLNIPADKQSRVLSDWLYFDAAEMPYDKTIESMTRKFDLSIHKLTVEQGLASQAAAFDEFLSTGKSPPQEKAEFLGVSADCKGVRMIPAERTGDVDLAKDRDGLRRMAVVDCTFGFNAHPRTPQTMVSNAIQGLFPDRETPLERSDKNDEKIKEKKGDIKWAIEPQFSASMFGKKAAFDRLAQSIKDRDPEGKTPLVLLVDGEKALLAGMLEAFKNWQVPNPIQATILDSVHAVEYLGQIAGTWFGFKKDRIKAKKKWFEARLSQLFHGKTDELIRSLEGSSKTRYANGSRHLIAKATTYFKGHKHMMHYDQYLEQGFPIATGIIEGACGSLVKDRMDIAGARWTALGAQAVLNMRAIKRNGDWDSFWKFLAKREFRLLYGHFSLNQD